jgi:hypothetical protein
LYGIEFCNQLNRLSMEFEDQEHAAGSPALSLSSLSQIVRTSLS